MNKESSNEGADDLKLITGIGPKTERRLHEAGVATYAQLATMSPADLADLLHDFAGMSAARIEEQGWVSQARDLVPEEASGSETTEGAPGNGQHYATFRIELLLDENSEVRRTRVGYIQGQEDRNWAGWDGKRLLDFMMKQASLRRPSADVTQAKPPGEPRVEAPRRGPLPDSMHSSLDLSRRHALRADPVNLRRLTLAHAEEAPQPGTRPPRSRSETAAPFAKMQVIPAGERQPSRVVSHQQPFSAHLTLEHPERLRKEGPVDYTASLFATVPGEPQAQTVGETRGTLSPGQADIDVGGRIDAPGTYRLEAHLTIGGRRGFSTTLRGGFVRVY